MSFDVSALADYTREFETELLLKSIAGNKSAGFGELRTGIKSAETLDQLDVDAIFQAGGTCGFLSSGTTTFSQRTLAVGKIKINEALCPKTLEAKATQKLLNPGSTNESITFEEQYASQKAMTVSNQIEVADWRGDTTSGDANLSRYDGYIKIIDAAGSAIDGNTGAVTVATGITDSNALALLEGMYSSIPEAVLDKEDQRIFVGFDTFRSLTINLRALNLFHFNPNEQTDFEIVLPGTTIVVVAIQGLTTTDRMFGMRTSNKFMGTDLENEDEKFEIFFAKEADEVRYVNEFKRGVQVAFPAEIVEFTLVP